MFNAIKSQNDLNISILLFALTILSRLPFTSKFLYHIDSVNYSLALKNYNISVHQPHPPGYFIYVMLGKFINLFIPDANTVYVSISIVFSGLAVAAIYVLAKKIYGQNIGIIASALAITSPNLWFHGEIALNYILEAFISTLIALLCWEILHGKVNYVFLLSIVLAISAGIRQNTILFLMPLILFCVKRVKYSQLAISLIIFVLIMMCWLIPMMVMSGGVTSYIAVFQEFWNSNTGHNSVFEKGMPVLLIYSKAIIQFILLGTGGGIALLLFSFYYIVRNNKVHYFITKEAVFLFLWVLPAILFYLLIFVHPGNPGYILIILPAILILTAKSCDLLSIEPTNSSKSYLTMIVLALLISTNLYIFFGTQCQVSNKEIHGHDKKLLIILDELKKYDPKKTVLFLSPSIVFGYRHIMYYLPDFIVIDPDFVRGPNGEIRRVFWGTSQQAHLSNYLSLSKEFVGFATLLKSDEKNVGFSTIGLTQKEILPGACLASGPMNLVHKIYPDSRKLINIYVENGIDYKL